MSRPGRADAPRILIAERFEYLRDLDGIAEANAVVIAVCIKHAGVIVTEHGVDAPRLAVGDHDEVADGPCAIVLVVDQFNEGFEGPPPVGAAAHQHVVVIVVPAAAGASLAGGKNNVVLRDGDAGDPTGFVAVGSRFEEILFFKHWSTFLLQ